MHSVGASRPHDKCCRLARLGKLPQRKSKKPCRYNLGKWQDVESATGTAPTETIDHQQKQV